MGHSLNIEQRSFLRGRLENKRKSVSADTPNRDLSEREFARAKEIDEAVERIESNTYGYCEECGVEIPFKRLQIVPETRYCIECERSLENENQVRSKNSASSFLKGMRAYINKGY